MKPTPDQQHAIETQDRALVVEAGAGTGKTWVLVQRFMHMLETHPEWSLDSILAITFTEKAAREMRTRLRQAIEDKVKESPNDIQWQDHRLNLDRMQVSTIHSLCARILRENAIAAAIDPRFQVLDEQESDLLKEEAIRATIQALDDQDHPALELLASLRVYDLHGEMDRMLGMRGTLHHLFADLEEPDALLTRWGDGISDLRNALWEEQLRENPILGSALVSLPFVAISNPEDKLAGIVALAQQGCDAHTQGDFVIAANCWLKIDLRGGRKANWNGEERLAELKANLGALRDAAKTLEKRGALREIGLEDEIAAQHLQLWRGLWELLDQTYSKIKESQQALDFDDLELLTDRLLHQTPRSHRMDGFLDHINHLMVDEFQDTNQIQQRIVYALAPLDHPGKLFVVGDAKQSIYRFRQAQVSIFNQTASEITSATGYPPVSLNTSFRTHHSLVEAANNLFDQILAPLGIGYATYEAAPGPLSAYREAHPDLPAPVEMLLLPEKDSDGQTIPIEDARIWEARWIANRLIELKEAQFPVWDRTLGEYRPFKYGDAAVLFRATTQFPLYEAEFKTAGLPYLTVSGRGYYDRPEIQDLIALLAMLANPADDLNLAGVLRSPLFSLSDETLYRLRWHTPDGGRSPEPTPFRRALSQPPQIDQPELVKRACQILSKLWIDANQVDVWTLLREALDLTSYEVTLAISDGNTGRQRSNIQKFLAIARERRETSLSDFLRRLGDLKDQEAREGEALGGEPESGAVQLMSIHAAKGLEFPVVVLADMGRQQRGGTTSSYLLHDPAYGLVCKVRDEAGDWKEPAGYTWGKWLHGRMEEAEQKRLLYVACTRASDLLILSGQVGNKDTWMTETLDAWEIPSEGDTEEDIDMNGFTIRIFRPEETVEIRERVANTGFDQAGVMETVPRLAYPLPVVPGVEQVAVTQLEILLGRDEDDSREFRPAIWRVERESASKRAPGYLVGNIVHKALAHWECLETPAGELFRLLESYAIQEGVFTGARINAVQRSHQILSDLKNQPIYQDIYHAQKRYHEVPFTHTTPLLKRSAGGMLHTYHEVPFTHTTPVGTLHGVIDLLYKDQKDEWHLLDWKTEWTPAAEIKENAQKHLMQMAVYAHAVHRSLGVRPYVALCFMVPRVVVHSLVVEKIDLGAHQ